jgi:hypothetical protein
MNKRSLAVPEYVILEGIKEGNRFYTSHTEGTDETKLANGKVAYKIIGYANTDEEAQRMCGHGISKYRDCVTMAAYLFKTGRGEFSREDCARLAVLLNEGGTR